MQNQENFPSSWYPICLSRELKRNSLKPIKLFGTDWILFRESHDAVGMLYRFCPHMGTDLANGCIIENYIRCPLHHWQFDKNGNRVEQSFDNSAWRHPLKSQHLPIQEKYGVIFAYWGLNPWFELPSLPSFLDLIYSKPTTMQLNNNYIAVTLNAFDIHHLTVVHNRIIDNNIIFENKNIYHLGIKFSLRIHRKRWQDTLLTKFGMGSSEIQYDCWGGNFITIQNPSTKFYAIMIMCPGEKDDESKFFLVVATNSTSRNFIKKFIAKQKLKIMRLFAVSFLRQDVEILKNMKPQRGLLSPIKDIGAIKFWDYFQKLPRFSISNHAYD